MKDKPEALLFDMDGTLTDARQPITTDVVDTLRLTMAGIKKHLVTGSDMFMRVTERWSIIVI